MLITATWLRVDARRRWRSLTVLGLLIAVATATVLTSVAGARRGESAWNRLSAETLPATATVLPNQPGFDWARIAALPDVAGLTRFPVAFGFEAQGYPAASVFPLGDDQMTRTIERPVILAGRLFNPRRVDEVVVTPKFAAVAGKHVGDWLTLELASVQQANAGYDGSSGAPAGPRIRVAHHRSDPQPVVRQLRRPRLAWRRRHDARPVHPVPGQHHGLKRPGVRERADPAQRRRGCHPRLPRGPGPGHRARRHRRMGQHDRERAPVPAGRGLRGRLPAGVRARGARRGPFSRSASPSPGTHPPARRIFRCCSPSA